MKRWNVAALALAAWILGPSLVAWCPAAAPNQQAASTRSAVQHLMATLREKYPLGTEFLRRLDDIEKRLGNANDSKVPADLAQLQRDALIANPLVSGQSIVFVVRNQYARDHHNTATFFPAAANEYNDGHFQEGAALKTIDFRNGGKVTTLLQLPRGAIRDPDVHFDAQRILFSMRKDLNDSYHIYQINADGSGLRQLTSAKDVDDLDPLYLPDDSIVFTSTREPKYCACNRHIMANLYKMNPDGSNIHQIGKSTLFEGHSSLLPDGRIMYDRWEYVDRNFGDAQGLWTCYPDGTHHAVHWGNNTPSPAAVVDARAIPQTHLTICTFTSCHDRPWGAIAIIDPRLGLDGRSPVLRIWPPDAINLVKDPGDLNGQFDLFMAVKLKYEDPYPLNDRFFVCSRMTGQAERMGLYLIDLFGNEILLHVEGPGCYDPMPLAPRTRPPVIPARRDYENNDGAFYVQDVYQGTHMRGVKRGQVKSLRVVESPEKRYWTKPGWNGQGFEGAAMNWHDFGNKTILGTVPVEPDGSAYFSLPSEKFVYFQLLDENGMMIQSMRSGVIVQSGEIGACIGCHEDRRTTSPNTRSILALRRPASRLQGWHGETRPLDYMRDVQPVFDKHCVSCHTYGQEAGKKLNLARDRGLAFNMSYAELWTKGLLTVAGAGPAEIMQPYSWGSHPSKLVQAIRRESFMVKLDRDSFERIVTWVDLNAPYYPSFATAYPENLYGRAPLNDAQIGRLAGLTGMKFDDPRMISFDRPQLSPCLATLAQTPDPRYTQAREIIEAGRAALLKEPGPDADGFVPCELDRWRDQKYAARLSAEMRSRQAIRTGQKVYDERGN